MPRRGRRVDAHAESLEDAPHFRVGNRSTDNAARPRRTEVHGLARGDLGRQFGDLDRAGHAASTREQQLSRTLDRTLLQRRIDATLEALRCVRDEPVATATSGDCVGPEERDFEQHVGRAGIDARVIAAHDARQRQRLHVIGNDHHGLVERHVATVEQAQRLAGARAAHDDAALELAQVIGVHRLAELEHHVVGHVDDCADRPQTRAP